MDLRMLAAFRDIFDGKVYRHRSSTHGDRLATELYEDLYAIGLSPKFSTHVDTLRRGICVENTRSGIGARRGDGTLGEFIPGQTILSVPGYNVRRGPVATLDIGVEVKILNKAMSKQINDRIAGLQKQADYFVTGRDRRSRGSPLSIAIIGINYAEYTVGYEGERLWKTDGHKYPHPVQEAPAVEERIRLEVVPHYNETIILRYKATNEDPFPFSWLDASITERDYGASLVRLAAEYERRF